jgi:hypothetical protein
MLKLIIIFFFYQIKILYSWLNDNDETKDMSALLLIRSFILLISISLSTILSIKYDKINLYLIYNT